MAKKNTALAVAESFQLVDRYAGLDPEMLEELKDQMDDLDQDDGIPCRKIKVPSGGSLAYAVQGEDDGDEEYQKEIKGVVIFTHRLNGYWTGSFGSATNPEDKLPTCASMDGKTGIVQKGDNTGEVVTCETCPWNQYGTGTDEKGNPSRGKACKNMRRLYLMLDGDPNAYLLTVPPTSIKDVNTQMKKILAGGVPYTGLIVSLTLEKTKNTSGIDYAKIVIKKDGLLPPEVAKRATALRRQIKEQYQNMTLTFDDYAAAPAENTGSGPRPAGKPVDVSAEDFNDNDGYQDATPLGDEELPFG